MTAGVARWCALQDDRGRLDRAGGDVQDRVERTVHHLQDCPHPANRCLDRPIDAADRVENFGQPRRSSSSSGHGGRVRPIPSRRST